MSTFSDLLLVWGAIASTLVRRDTQPCTTVFDDSWQLLVTTEPSPYLTYLAKDGCRLWLVGELAGYQQARTNKESLHLFLDEWLAGTAQPAALNGHFLLFLWHGRYRQWHIWTDRLGTLHAYYGHHGRQAAIGTFCPAVAQAVASRQLDWYGLAGFFSWGFFPQDRTHYEVVRLLRPATCYVFDENGQLCQEKRYWQWAHEPDKGRSYEDTVAEFAAIFEEVLAGQTADGRIALPISGGLDSRSIVAAVTGNGRSLANFWAYSYGYTAGSIETRIGKQVAQARGLPSHSYTIQPYLFANLERVMTCVEGFQDVTQCRQAAIAGPLRQQAEVVLAGHWGDVWLDTMGLPEQEPPDLLESVIHKLEKGGRTWLLDNFGLQGQMAHLWEEVAANLEQYSHLNDLDFRVKAFKTDQWSWRWTTASLRMFQMAVWPRLPFYDNRLVDFFGTVPSHFLAGRRLQIDYLKRFAPDLARITWQPYQTNLYHSQHFHAWLVPARLLRKARRWLNRQPAIARNWEVQLLQGNGRRQLYDLLVRPGRPVHEFVSPTTIQSLLDAFYQRPESKSGYTVSMLLTFSTWLEQYG
jgi:hypothetical protein